MMLESQALGRAGWNSVWTGARGEPIVSVQFLGFRVVDIHVFALCHHGAVLCRFALFLYFILQLKFQKLISKLSTSETIWEKLAINRVVYRSEVSL